MRTIILIFLSISIFGISKAQFKDTITYNNNQYVLKEKALASFSSQKNESARLLEQSGNLSIASYSVLLASALLAGSGIALDNIAITSSSVIVASVSIPLGIASGVKKKKSAKQLKMATFYQSVD